MYDIHAKIVQAYHVLEKRVCKCTYLQKSSVISGQMTQGCASPRIFAFFQIILANLVTNVASVTFNLSLVKVSWFLINDVVPRASVDVVNDVVKLDSAIG